MYCSGPPILYLMNLLLFQNICVYFTIYAHSYSMWTQSLQKSCLYGFCKSIPFSWSFMEICSRSLGRSGTVLKAEAHDTVLGFLGSREKCRGVSVTLHGCQKRRCRSRPFGKLSTRVHLGILSGVPIAAKQMFSSCMLPNVLFYLFLIWRINARCLGTVLFRLSWFLDQCTQEKTAH